MPEEEPPGMRTYFFEGPLSFSSMISQIFLSAGWHYAPQEQAGLTVSVRGEERTWQVSVLSRDGSVSQVFQTEGTRGDVGEAVMDRIYALSGLSLGKWGYLVGMRPVKALFPFFAEGEGWEAKAREFLSRKKVRSDTADLLIQTASRERPYIPALAPDSGSAAFYVHIPFCPSHCIYCSFPAAVVAPGEDLSEFTGILTEDIKQAGQMMARKGIRSQPIYIGGGTPTVLPPLQLDRVLQCIKEFVPAGEHCEWTVEAGRPDTLNADVFSVLKKAGVSRISVNPQTMQDRILKMIGRCHRAGDVFSAFDKARTWGFRQINMDFIFGLPSQTEKDGAENLSAVCKLRPENVTIHTLAVKRGSPFFGKEGYFDMPPEETVDRMLTKMHQGLLEAGYHPYYLYRQKYMRDDFANIGYSLDGQDCIYNIQMMGERQNVVGAGPGSVSKWADSRFRLRKMYMPRDPRIYGKRLAENMEKRSEMFKI